MSGVPLYGTVALIGLATLATLWLTWRRLAASPVQRGALVALRAGAAAVVALMILNPVSDRQTTVVERPRVAVLIDRSLSMSVRDAPGGVTRFAWAGGLLRPGAPLARALAAADLASFVFADDVRPAALPLTGAADGAATDLQSALIAALQARAEGKPEAVVLLSDGAVNRGPSREELTAWVERERTPLYCLGVGSAQRPPDAWLARVDAPRTVKAGSAATVVVTVGSRGLDGRTAGVSLRGEGLASDHKSAHLSATNRPRLEYVLRPGKPGLYRCTVELASLPGEWTAANNTRTFFLRVTPGESKLLFLAGQPSRELKFIRRALETVPDLRVTYLIRESGQTFREDSASPHAEARLPAGEGLSSQDALVLADVPAEALSLAELQRLAEFVRVRGGGLGVLGGPDSFDAGRYAGTPLAAALGVSLGGRDGYSPLAVKAQPTPDAGSISPTSDIARHEGFPGWEALPFLAGANPVGGVKPGATTLLQSGAGPPLLVVQRYGLGRTLCWLTDSSYRWVLSKDATTASQQGHAIFWAGIVAWLTTPPNRAPVALETDRDSYERGDTARVIAQVSDAGFQPVARAEVVVDAVGERGTPSRVRLTEVAGAPGRYEAGLVVGPPGKVTLKAQASLQGKTLGADTRDIIAEAPRGELADPAQNVALLQTLGQASGGAYLPAQRAAEVDRLLQLAPRPRATWIHHAWARGRAALLAFLCLAGLDWLLRRWWGLG